MLERLEDWVDADGAARADGLDRLLNRIRRIDPLIHAWVQVLPRRNARMGALAGIPFGVKDVIETAGLATEYGSPIYKGRLGSSDAAIVQGFERCGALLLGKTRTAAFACRTPAATRNPRHLLHTPGGSSSGSAAAVAAGMVPVAIGTQTHGSVLRPASYCGVTGFKPGYGILPTAGVLPVASSLDTLGLFTHTPAGMLLLWEALGYRAGIDHHAVPPTDVGKADKAGTDQEVTVFGVLDPLPRAEPPMAAAIGQAVRVLRQRGFSVQPVPLAHTLDRLFEESRIVEQYEGARVHDRRFEKYGDRLRDVADLVRAGRAIADSRYRAALAFIAEGREQMLEQYHATPIILGPAATGPAPRGLASTGDPRMNSPWTAIGAPAISIPLPFVHGLPMGLQLTAAPGQDLRVLHAAVTTAQVLE